MAVLLFLLRYFPMSFFFLFFFIFYSIGTSQETLENSNLVGISSVFKRFLHSKNDNIFPELMENERSFDIYEYEAHDGKVYIRGSSSNAICRGAYDFLRKVKKVNFSWEGTNIQLPDKFLLLCGFARNPSSPNTNNEKRDTFFCPERGNLFTNPTRQGWGRKHH